MTWHLIAGLLLAATPAPDPVPLPAEPAPVPSAGELLALSAERYRRLTVPVTIQGQGPFRFMIDTGAQATVLSRSLADQLALTDRRPATLVGMASRVATETVAVADMQLGSRTFYVRTAPLVDGPNIGDADGILGLDSLQDQRVLFDFQQRSLLVADAPEKGGTRGFDIVVKAREKLGQLIITEAHLDGIAVAVIVDTGAQGSIGNPELLSRLRRARSLGETSLTDVNGIELAGEVRLGRELKLGSARLRNFPLMFADSPTFQVLGLSNKPALVLGMAELQLFGRVAIDFRSRRVLFDMPSNTPRDLAGDLDRLRS
jgi:predicted aspartyl protease